MGATQTLINLYDASTPTVRRRGRAWYPEARRRLLRMADEYDRTLAQAVAVFAITSQNTQLLQNLRYTEKILRGDRDYGCFPTHQTPLIRGVLSTRYPARYVRGPKCSAFYRAILGDTDILVLDRWTARATGYQGRDREFSKTVRHELELAYRGAARICGETVRSFQAIAWIIARESTPTKNNIVRALTDIESTPRYSPPVLKPCLPSPK
jgi:hypothetical protein